MPAARAIRLVPLKKRQSKVDLAALGARPVKGVRFRDFWAGLPDILAVKNMRFLVERIRGARRLKKPVIVMFGAHVIKAGLSRYLGMLAQEGWVTALATNGASVIHDFELSYAGHTSEDVAKNLAQGTFGFAAETGMNLNAWAKEAAASGKGLGFTVGERIAKSDFPNKGLSLYGTC